MTSNDGRTLNEAEEHFIDAKSGEEYLALSNGPWEAQFQHNTEDGEAIVWRDYHGETALQCALRDFNDAVIKVVHG
jgi:hypothetical protein